jgi:hypothetical protein
MQVVNSISCINNGGFRMKFKLQWPGGESGWSDFYNNPESESFDLTDFNIAEGAEVWIIVAAMWGKTKTADEHVKYSSSANANATYKVTGATLTYHISLEG